jgi:hypothetical protein
MKVNMNGGEVIIMKIPDFDPAKVILSDYTGTFHSRELSTDYEMVYESGKLIARHFRTGDVMLTLTKPDQFTGDKWYFRMVQFTRDSEGKISGLSASGGRTRNLKFEKTD